MKKLVKDLADPETFEEVTGKRPCREDRGDRCVGGLIRDARLRHEPLDVHAA